MQQALAQQKLKGSVKGTIRDSLRTPVSEATVSLIRTSDSTVDLTTLSGRDGRFSLTGIGPGDYILLISFSGSSDWMSKLSVNEQQKDWIFDSVMLVQENKLLPNVVVTSIRPLTVRGDTMEFNPAAFKTKPNAVVEELLRKLPGAQVDREGNITYQGQPITQVLVDGRPFFGGDPKMATQNLPVNIVDKIQFIDRKSEQAQFTRIDDGQREKVLNITIKKDKNKGYFGEAAAGLGNEDRSLLRLNANRFDGNRQYSLFSRIMNRINNDENGFSQNRGGGIGRNGYVGASFRKLWKQERNISVSYNFNQGLSENETGRSRRNILADTFSTYNSNESRTGRNWGHNMRGNLEWRFDSMTMLRSNIDLGMGIGRGESESAFSSLYGGKRLLNQGGRVADNESKNYTGNFGLTFMRRLKKKGRSIFMNMNGGLNEGNNENRQKNNTVFYREDGTFYPELVHQQGASVNQGNRFSINANYVEPLSKYWYLSANLSYSASRSATDRTTLDYDQALNKFSLLNPALSDSFANTSRTKATGLTLSHNRKSLSFNTGFGWSDNLVSNRSFSTGLEVKQAFRAFTPSASLSYNEKNKRFNLHYRGSTRPPGASQLQPIADNSNPLYIRLGNPDLKFEFTHSLNLDMNLNNRKTGSNFNASGNFSTTSNRILDRISFDSATGKQVSQPVNVNGAWNAYGNIGYSRIIIKKKLSGSMNLNGGINRAPGFINLQKSNNRNSNLGLRANLNFTPWEWLELGYSMEKTWASAHYSVQPDRDTRNNTTGHNASLELEFPLDIDLDINLYYRNTRGQASGFNQESTNLNFNLSKGFFKEKLSVQLRGYDLLNQNNNIFRTTTESYFEDVQTNIIQRYFMLVVSYRLNRSKGK